MLFDKNTAAGFFMGLEEGGLSFGAEITLNYDAAYQSQPMIGVYVVVELERPDEAVLGRITAVSSHGRLASSAGEDMGARAVEQRRDLSEDIKKQFLRYKCSVRLLGLLRENKGTILFTPSHRRLPHMGAKVAFASDELLKAIAGGDRAGETIGFLAMGEFIYAQGHSYASKFPANFQIMSPVIEPRFDAHSMVSRRTAVLAKSGYGKSNLLKILFARLYENGSPIEYDQYGNKVPVGTLVFDPDGDYFWPGAKATAPPGLCDIPSLSNHIILATDRPAPANYYGSFCVSSARVDLRSLPPGQVVSIAVSSERQSHRGTEALYRLDQTRWNQLVDAAWLDLNGSPRILSIAMIQNLCRIQKSSAGETSANGVRNTMLDIVAKLHNPKSVLIQAVKKGLLDGKLVIIDLSLMRGQPATIISSLVLRHIFEHNVEEYTKCNGRPFPVIALIEEAQKVLEGNDTSHTPFIEWVKEGRKYGLGATLVTQQPGAIDKEILSQTDSFFVFHLVSSGDLNALKMANGHFSDDILATLLNEPIEGQGVFWSSAGTEKSTYPIPFRAYNFADLHQRLSDSVIKTTPNNYAVKLKYELGSGRMPTVASMPMSLPTSGLNFKGKAAIDKKVQDVVTTAVNDDKIKEELAKNEFPLFVIENWLKEKGIRKKGTEQFVIDMLTVQLGLYGYGWELKNKTAVSTGREYKCVHKLNPEDGRTRYENGENPLIPDSSNEEYGYDAEHDEEQPF